MYKLHRRPENENGSGRYDSWDGFQRFAPWFVFLVNGLLGSGNYELRCHVCLKSCANLLLFITPVKHKLSLLDGSQVTTRRIGAPIILNHA